MTKRDLLIKVLKDMDLEPELDKDGDVSVVYQLKNVYFVIGDEEEKYLLVLLPQFYDVEEGEESLILLTCNKMNREMRMGKVYMDQAMKSVYAATEFIYTDEESLRQNVDNALGLIAVVRRFFREEKASLEEE